MKKFSNVVIIILLLSTLFGCSYKKDIETENILVNTQNLNDLKRSGFEEISEQTFMVDLEKWGKVKFVSGQFLDGGRSILELYLLNDKEKILYHFPDFMGNNSWTFFEIRAISFKDINKDGLKDIIVIADYVTGIGSEGSIPFPVCSIYFQGEKEFYTKPDLDKEINASKQNESIDMVVKFVEEKKDF